VGLGEVLYGGVADQVQGEQARSSRPGRALESFEALQWNLKKIILLKDNRTRC